MQMWLANTLMFFNPFEAFHNIIHNIYIKHKLYVHCINILYGGYIKCYKTTTPILIRYCSQIYNNKI